MSPSAKARLSLALVFFSALSALAPSIWGQGPKLSSEEVRDHFDPAFQEVFGKSNLDSATKVRIRDALRKGFSHTNGTWDQAQARDRVAEVLRGTSTGTLDDPVKPRVITHLRGSDELVNSFASVIRRRNIVWEIGGGAPREQLDRRQLLSQLFLHAVYDSEDVARSFNTHLAVEMCTFEKDTPVLRLYGGRSERIGRYYFCCLWRSQEDLSNRWTDASGLAPHPENLLDHLAVTKIPAGTTAFIGTVADNFPDASGRMLPGGNTQIFIPVVEPKWPFDAYQFKDATTAVSEIKVHLDDRKLWFRKQKLFVLPGLKE